jgi:ADP-ribosylation factor-binding protein GGA
LSPALYRKLLQSKNPDDLQNANKIIKGMVREDEKKMDALTRRSTELVMVNNNSKLLCEMLGKIEIRQKSLLRNLCNATNNYLAEMGY